MEGSRAGYRGCGEGLAGAQVAGCLLGLCSSEKKMHASKVAHQVTRTDLARLSCISLPVITPKRMDGVPFTCMKGSYACVGASRFLEDRVDGPVEPLASGVPAWRARSSLSGLGMAHADTRRPSMAWITAQQAAARLPFCLFWALRVQWSAYFTLVSSVQRNIQRTSAADFSNLSHCQGSCCLVLVLVLEVPPGCVW